MNEGGRTDLQRVGFEDANALRCGQAPDSTVAAADAIGAGDGVAGADTDASDGGQVVATAGEAVGVARSAVVAPDHTGSGRRLNRRVDGDVGRVKG